MWKQIFEIWTDTILLRAFMPTSWQTARRKKDEH